MTARGLKRGWNRLRRLIRARRAATQTTPRGKAATIVICLIAGFMMSVAAIAARGTDLRADRNLSLRELVAAQGERNTELLHDVTDLRGEVNKLTDQLQTSGGGASASEEVALAAGSEPVTGPGLRVVLNDAPAEVKPAGVDDDALVVHQQDIQAVVNALWAGEAEAISIQGQRVIATTGIKCVGNSVVLHGIPYAPPYVIDAIGDGDVLAKSLDASEAIRIYRQYVQAYGLGYETTRIAALELPAYEGASKVTHAKVG